MRDLVAGWKDGRRGLPVVRLGDSGPELVLTGHLLSIYGVAGEGQDRRYRRLLDDTREDRVEHVQSPPKIDMLQLRIVEYKQRLADTVDVGPAKGRRMGETRLPEDQVQRRREREYERRLSYLRKEITESRNRMAEYKSRQGELETHIEAARLIAVADGETISGQATARVASYVKGASRSHPDADALVKASSGLRTTRRDWLDSQSPKDFMAHSKGEHE